MSSWLWARMVPRMRWCNTAFISAIIIAAFFGNEFRSQDWDPMYIRTLVDRVARYGGSYYENGIHNKGPLEPAVYHLASVLTGWSSYWYAISAFVLLSAFVLGVAAARVTRTISGHRALGGAVVMAVVIHFTLSGADYAGVLYSRNMTVTALAGAFALLLDEPLWAGRRRISPATATIVLGVLFGICVQTLTTAALSVTVLGCASYWLMGTGCTREQARKRFVRVMIVAAVTFAAAPAWYIARGKGDMFWDSWWVYGTYMTRSTGRSLSSQLSLGWSQFYAYYQVRPIAAAVIIGFAVLTRMRWPHWGARNRALHLCLLGWWIAACLEITLTQRNSSHYFSLTTLPTILMAAALFGHTLRAWPIDTRRQWATPALSAAMASMIFFSNPISFVAGIRAASQFRGFDTTLRIREQGAGGSTYTTRAILDLVSNELDPLLMWTNAPWPYLSYHRVSATRFIWKSFLMGEIYLGRTSLDWVLPHSWDNWLADIQQTNPRVFVLEKSTVLDPNTIAADYIASHFSNIYQEPDVRIDFRRDVAEAILSPRPDTADPWVRAAVPGESGWSASVREATFTQGATPAPNDPLFLSGAGTCLRVDGEIPAIDGARPAIVFQFTDPTSKNERRHLAVESSSAVAGSANVTFGKTALVSPISTPLRFTLLVGPRSAVLVAEGRIVAAIRLDAPAHVHVESRSAKAQLRDLHVSQPPPITGC